MLVFCPTMGEGKRTDPEVDIGTKPRPKPKPVLLIIGQESDLQRTVIMPADTIFPLRRMQF